MVIYSTAEIAVLVGKSERSVQLWLKSGKLPARRVKANLYEIEDAVLEPFIPRTLEISLLDRMDALERRISDLEAILTARDTRQENIQPIEDRHRARHPAQPNTAHVKTGSLPDGLISLSAFAAGHNIAQTTARKAAEDGRLPVTRGKWKQGKVYVETALNPMQQRSFVDLFANNPGWKPCAQCPHA